MSSPHKKGAPRANEKAPVLASDDRPQKSVNDRILRLEYLKSSSADLAEYVYNHHPDLAKSADSLLDCGSYLRFRDYYLRSDVRLVGANFCKHRLCIMCQARRASLYLNKYLEKFQCLMTSPEFSATPFLVTYTIKSEKSLAASLSKLNHAARTLSKRRSLSSSGRYPATMWRTRLGALHSTEVTVNEDTGLYHPHIHALELHSVDWLPHQSIKDEWREVTGGSHVVNVKRVHHAKLDLALRETLKYITKPGSLDPRQQIEVYRATRHSTLLRPYGCLRGVTVPDSLLDDPIHAEPYLELVYAWLRGSYGLISTHSSGPSGPEDSPVTE